ncbi:hypothetical protein EON62_03735, partial [archaeon]
RVNAATQAQLAELRLQPMAQAIVDARRAPSGESELVAVRGAAAAEDASKCLLVAGAPAPVVYMDTAVHVHSHAIEAGKLVERKRFAKMQTFRTGWKAQDATGEVRVHESMGAPSPLLDLPAVFERLEEPMALELALTRNGIVLYDKRDRERAFGISKSHSVLSVGTLLTLVGHIVVRPDGSAEIRAGTGPAIISTDTLAGIVRSYQSSSKGWTVFAALSGLTALGIAAWTLYTHAAARPSDAGAPPSAAAGHSLRARRRDQQSRTTPAEDTAAEDDPAQWYAPRHALCVSKRARTARNLSATTLCCPVLRCAVSSRTMQPSLSARPS